MYKGNIFRLFDMLEVHFVQGKLREEEMILLNAPLIAVCTLVPMVCIEPWIPRPK